MSAESENAEVLVKQHVSAAPDNLCGPPVNICFSISEERALPRCEQCLVVQEHTVMSLKVSIGQGTRGVIVEKDRKKEKKVLSLFPIFHFLLTIFLIYQLILMRNTYI